MDITEVIVEYRSKIRASQFFIKGKFNIEKKEIKIEEDNIELFSGNSSIAINFPRSICHIKNSLSGLLCDESLLTFRARTNPDKIFGSFNSEIILPTELNNSSSFNYIPKIKTGQLIKIFCRYCLNQLTPFISFERILPLPLHTGTEEFFCHSSSKLDFDPKSSDLLYSMYYFRIHSSVFIQTIKNENSVFKCPTCSSWVGIITQRFVQLWDSTVVFNTDDNILEKKDVALKNFLSLVNQIFLEDNFSLDKINKLVFNCPYMTDDTITEYLLVWVIERQLILFRSQEPITKPTVILQEYNVMKILYLQQQNKTNKVKEWLSSLYSVNIEISKNMFLAGLEYLMKMSTYIPDKFRHTNDMTISYLGYVQNN